MKTILHVIDSAEPGGAETVFVQLAVGLRDRGFRCITVVCGSGWPAEELQRQGFSPYVINGKGSFNWRLVRKLVSIIKAENIDVVQSHLLGSNVYCALAGLITRTPVIATFHGMVDVSHQERLRWLKFLIMNLGVTQFVAVSHKLKEAIAYTGSLNSQKTTVIYNGVDFSKYSKNVERKIRQALSLDEDSILIGSLGNMHPAKGYDYLVRAVSRVLDKHANTHFVIGGNINPDLVAELTSLISREGVMNHVHFLGFIEDSAQFLSELDVFLLPSISEGFSIATIEAMAAGLPCVITRCGGPEEIVTDRIDALLISACDSHAIADALNSLLASSELSSKLALQARASVTNRFSLNTTIENYVKLYKSSDEARSGHPPIISA